MSFVQRMLKLISGGILAGAVLVLVGCGKSKPDAVPAAPAAAKTDAQAEVKPVPSAQGAFVLGDDIEPFNPPSFEELDKMAEWEDSPVVDAMAELRKVKEDEPALVTVEQALSMRNDSPEANKKILSALSVLPPPD